MDQVLFLTEIKVQNPPIRLLTARCLNPLEYLSGVLY